MQVPSVTQLNIPLQVQGVTSGTTITTATNIPPALAVLPAATILKGNVTGRDQQGNTLLRTEKGTLVLATDFTLKRGVELSIKLDKVQDKLFARIITIDGKSVAKYVESQQGGAVPDDDVIIAPRPLTGSASGSAQAQLSKEALTPFPQLKAILLSALPTKAEGFPPQTTTPLPPLPPSVEAVIQQAKAGTLLTIEIRQVQFPDSSLTPTNLPAAASIVAQNAAATSAASILSTTAQSTLPELTTPLTSNAATQTQPAQAAGPQTPLPSQTAASTPTPLPTAAGSPPTATASIAVQAPATGASPAPSPAAPPPLSSQPPAAQSITSTMSGTHAANPAIATTPPRPTTPAPAPQAYTAYTQTARIPVAPPQQPAQAVSPSLIQGIVVGESEGDDLIVQSPLGLMRVMVPQLLPTGTKIFFQIMQAELPSTTEQTATSTLAAGQSAGAKPDSLQILQSLTYLTTGIGASPNPVHLLPRPGNEMTTELFFLLSAIKGGDVRKWLENQPRRELEKLGDINMTRLQQEFSGLRHVVVDTRDQSQWNLYHLPIVTGQELHEAKFYYRDPRDQNQQSDGKKREESEHFVFDITFSRIGHMQLDGLIRRPEKNKLAFDLTIRSDNPLPQEMTRQIHAIFATTQEVAGFSGSISFRAGIGACLPMDTPQPAPAGNTSSILA